MSDDCIFCKIVRGEIPSSKVYEDDLVLAFKDIHPIAPMHILVVPKAHIAKLSDAGSEHEPALGRLLKVSGEIAAANGSTDGYRCIINTGRVGRQDVYHVHMHLLGGTEPLRSGLLNKAS
jgi:histidine triad (HIT) family protein